MTISELLADAFGRVRSLCRRALADTDAETLAARVDPEANTIAWLVWHLSRIQDDHIAAAADLEQCWTAQGWYERFALPIEATATGYGQTAEEVARCSRIPGDLLLGYHEAVIARTLEFVGGLVDGDLDRVVDTSYDPPVTLGVRLVSVLSDNLQHAGQAAYVKGVIARR